MAIKKTFIDDGWINMYWRPVMALTYTVICVWDFIVAPIFFQLYAGNGITWKPLTLEGGGLFHMSMGAIVGITAWTRGVEKQKLIENFDKIATERIDFNNEFSKPPTRRQVHEVEIVEELPDERDEVAPRPKKRRSYKDIVADQDAESNH